MVSLLARQRRWILFVALPMLVVLFPATAAYAGTSPSQPVNVEAVETGTTTASLSWGAPVSSGSSGIVSYTIVTYDQTTNSSDPNVAQVKVCGSCYNATVTGLQEGKSYFFLDFVWNATNYSYAASNAYTPPYPAEYSYPGPYSYYEPYFAPDQTASYENFPTSAVGLLQFQTPSGEESCTASVVSSASADLIWTAGHCVWNTSTHSFQSNNAANWVFYPAYRDGVAPYGAWTGREVQSTSGYENNGDLRDDLGAILLSTNSAGQHIQNVVGGLGYVFSSNVGLQPYAQVNAYGYPNGGGVLKDCDSTYSTSSDPSSDTSQQPAMGIGCTEEPGISGGPWIAQYSNQNGSDDYVVSVNSFTWIQEPLSMYGPYQGPQASSLYSYMA